MTSAKLLGFSSLTPVLVVLLCCASTHFRAQYPKGSSTIHTEKYHKGYDVLAYELTVGVNPSRKTLSGSNVFYIKALEASDTLRFDLDPKLRINYIEWQGKKRPPFHRSQSAVLFSPPKTLEAGKEYSFKVSYGGSPQEAKNPPWDGGFVWAQDTLNHSPWVGVACQSDGAQIWWPCKRDLGDEPEHMTLKYIVPDSLQAIGNGQLLSKAPFGKRHTLWTWSITYPINTYNVSLYVGKYAHLEDTYTSSDESKLELDYWVLKGNEDKAQEHFQQVKPMLAAYEKRFGKYPFWKDGYALVEAPYWGMEHQSAIAYGNHFQNNKWGFDFIIIHESGHEWWGNSVSITDHGELWIHEAFCTYAEALYLEETQGAAQMQSWLNWQRTLIKNEMAILGPLGVHYDEWPDADMYYKGTWMLHTLRSMVDDQEKWYRLLRDFYQTYKMSFIPTQDVIDYFSKAMDRDLQAWFDFYLSTTQVPHLQLEVVQSGGKTTLSGHFTNTSDAFQMPIEIQVGQQKKTFVFSGQPQSYPLEQFDSQVLEVDLEKYYISYSTK